MSGFGERLWWAIWWAAVLVSGFGERLSWAIWSAAVLVSGFGGCLCL